MNGHVHLGDVQETALIPLSNRAAETMRKHPRMRDEKAAKIKGNCIVLSEDSYYRHISRKNVKFATRCNMFFSDLFRMVKMVHLKLGD